ncbi:unnamed protein product [Urochloa decumbens]|uniref:VWFA domain-containing protein n=1 Tax=Urochloa decumbens TaxID=240449 RepID=A0ABC8XJ66_9POAL
MYQDDESLEPRQISPAPTGGGGRMVLTAQCEAPSLGRGASQDSFAVLVHARAAAAGGGAPLDLVAVLYVSSSMRGNKLSLLKQAVRFVVDQLGPDDRLSVVIFSRYAARLTRLVRMSAAGKAAARSAVGFFGGRQTGTNIADGLRVGAQVLAGRRHRNPVASVISSPTARTGPSRSRHQQRCTWTSCRLRSGAPPAPPPVAAILRPLELTCTAAPFMDVESERVRVEAAEDIAAARVKAESGEHAGAARILESRLRAVERSAPGVASDDPTCEAIKEELRELSARVGDRREYQKTGRACLLAGMSSHAQQRASGVELQATATSANRTARAYLTPKMEEMVEVSRESRKRGSSEHGDGGSRQLATGRLRKEIGMR